MEINEGDYDVSVNYGDATSNTGFSVGYEIIEQDVKPETDFEIITDESQYIPGQTILITGFTSEVIPFEGMKFTVTDAGGNLISNGNLFPTDGDFKTSVFLTTVNSKLWNI